MRTKFNKVLNIEPKIYNLSYIALAGGIVTGVTGACLFGFSGFFGGFTVGFVIGKKLGEGIWAGNVQRYLYRNLPAAFTLGITGSPKSIPPSHIRRLL